MLILANVLITVGVDKHIAPLIIAYKVHVVSYSMIKFLSAMNQFGYFKLHLRYLVSLP